VGLPQDTGNHALSTNDVWCTCEECNIMGGISTGGTAPYCGVLVKFEKFYFYYTLWYQILKNWLGR